MPYSRSVVQISYQSVSNLHPIKPEHSDCSTRLFTGDLGVQRGVCRWHLSLHSEEHPIVVSPEKRKTPAKPKSAKKGKNAAKEVKEVGGINGNDGNDTLGASGSGDLAGTVTNIPPPFTPSVTKVLRTKPLLHPPPGLPDGLSVATLKSRLSGKKIK